MPGKILIIDDDPDVILFLSTLLQDQGYEPVDAQNGVEGLEKAKADRPDLILLDLMMPEKSGIALLQDLKKDEELKHIPIIMVTGVSGETGIDLETFFERNRPHGSEGDAPRPEAYLEKPVDPDRLLALIRDILE
ncbi:MAG: response regulator [Deltaproteobacteria bacterium]|mgnify:CR=1 FL=1|nr:response regulator [Deltaproteobacteria bacterium]MBW1924329.1 response regulator [Deltaproteobacteria bacterium]MBW1948468.1 response regulator [Deltaproteobacteria bacterium]MBW2007480.1 response regulator [Deltaproteobacteria bacterium]MBW2348086.1 response regulator [Deltaproteobacteria bacterium]